jgi:hypothetical protein
MKMVTTAQIQGTIRFVMTTAGTVLGMIGAQKIGNGVTGAEPYIEACVGPVLALGSYVWNLYAHTASGLGTALAKTKQ